MKERSYVRLERIMDKVQEYKRRKERSVTAAVCAACPMLALGIVAVLGDLCTGGLITAGAVDGASGYGAVLLHDGANAYVITAIAAFVVGTVFTALCLWYRGKK